MTGLPHSPFKLALSEHFRKEAEAGSTIDGEHRMVRDLCNELEVIADGLPALPQPHQLVAVSAALRAGIPAHCRHEEAELRQHLQSSAVTPSWILVALRCLEDEHRENETLGHELAEALEEIVEENRIRNAEALGYMLRMYFQTLRRHLIWEEIVLDHVSR